MAIKIVSGLPQRVRMPFDDNTSPGVGVPFGDTSTAAAQAVPSANTDSPGLITVGNLEHSTSFSGVNSLLALKKSQGRDVDSSKNRKGPERKNNSSGRWTASEHEAFLEGLKVYGREWKKVALYIPTRTRSEERRGERVFRLV